MPDDDVWLLNSACCPDAIRGFAVPEAAPLVPATWALLLLVKEGQGEGGPLLFQFRDPVLYPRQILLPNRVAGVELG